MLGLEPRVMHADQSVRKPHEVSGLCCGPRPPPVCRDRGCAGGTEGPGACLHADRDHRSDQGEWAAMGRLSGNCRAHRCPGRKQFARPCRVRRGCDRKSGVHLAHRAVAETFALPGFGEVRHARDAAAEPAVRADLPRPRSHSPRSDRLRHPGRQGEHSRRHRAGGKKPARDHGKTDPGRNARRTRATAAWIRSTCARAASRAFSSSSGATSRW